MFKELSIRNVIFALISWWLVWAAIQWYILHYYGIPSMQALCDAAINIGLLAITSLVVFNTIKFYRPSRGNLLYVRIWSIMHALFIGAIHAIIVTNIYHHDANVVYFLEHNWPLRYIFNLIMIGISTTAIIIYYYIKEENENEQRKDDAEKLAKETELIKLRQQLQPHFLFNSLNSISALAGSRPEEARKMIQQLSDFLRGTLRKDEQALTGLKEEMEHLQLYLEIEKVRFGHRLETTIKVSENCTNAILPPLILQPIVENSIKFGLYDTTEKVHIEIYAELIQNELMVVVKNPFDSQTAQPKKGTGFGLSSIQRRLYLIYGRTDLLHTASEGQQFITTILIPQP